MADIEKIIKAIERCLVCNPSPIASEEANKAYLDCEYTVGLYCGQEKLLYHVIEALKEQKIVRCKDCRWWHPDYKQQKGYCGQANGMTEKQPTWFCADGERMET